MVRAISRSEPNERDMVTKRARPRLASQAASVKRSKRKNGLCCGVAWANNKNITKDRTIDSIARRAIRRWVRWDRKSRSVRIRGIGRSRRGEIGIAGGWGVLSLGYKTSAIILASAAVRRQRAPIVNFQS